MKFCPSQECGKRIDTPLLELYTRKDSDLVVLKCPHCQVNVFPCENCFHLVKDPNHLEETIDYISCHICGFVNVFQMEVRLLLGKSFPLSPIPYSVARIIQLSIDPSKYLHSLKDTASFTRTLSAMKSPLHTPPKGSTLPKKTNESPLITNSQKDYTALPGDTEDLENPEIDPVSSPEENLLQYWNHIHAQQLCEPMIRLTEYKKLKHIEGMTRGEYKEIPEFTPSHLAMLSALYESSKGNEKDLMKEIENFLRQKAYIVALKEESDAAQKVYERSSRLQPSAQASDQISIGIASQFTGNLVPTPLTAHQITINILYYRYLRLREVLKSHTELYFKLLAKCNVILQNLYECMNEPPPASTWKFTPEVKMSGYEHVKTELGKSFEISLMVQKVFLWRLFYRSLSLLII